MSRLFALIFVVTSAAASMAAEPSQPKPSAIRGYRALVEKAYLPPDFDQETFDATWKQWPEPLRSEAEKATAEERRRMAIERYGLTPRPHDAVRPDDRARPLQYVVDKAGNWTMNCFACHGGQIPDGKGDVTVWPGAPNSRFALQTLTEETRLAKVDLIKPLSRMDLGSAFVPLGSTNGTTNAVMFGVVLMAFRDANLNVRGDRPVPQMTHHDMDAPPWWHFQRKKMIYIDGFAEKGHRGLMQFMLVKSNGPEKFRLWELEFRDVFAYISSIQPPKYPYPVDAALAERGRFAFNRVCADCHGTYRTGSGQDSSYPEKLIPIGEIGTDRVRLDALSPAHRDSYGQSWFADFGRKVNLNDPGGYVAPPLDGVWASSPYFHNGSVPTLWHVLHPDQRPIVWKRSASEFDADRVGWKTEIFETLPPEITDGWQKREYFDTRSFGKSAGGHDFPDALSEEEKRAVLEYLKTL